MKNPKQKVGSAGIIATVGTLIFYVFTPTQVDLRSHDVQGIVIHCSATPELRKTDTPKAVDGYHTLPKPRGRGEAVNPYNVIIGYDSAVWFRRWNNDSVVNRMEISWGSANYNIAFFNICVVGGMSRDMKYAKNTLTEKQDSLLWAVVVDFKKHFPFGFVIGHNQVAPKACPSFDVPKWIKYHSKKYSTYDRKQFNL